MEKNSKKCSEADGGYRIAEPDSSEGVGSEIRMGLFEQPFAMDGESCKKIFEEKEGAELSLRSARESWCF